MISMMKAKVTWFNDSKGYGLAETEDGLIVFCHYSQIKSNDEFKSLKPGQEIQFDAYERYTADGERGVEAKNIEVI